MSSPAAPDRTYSFPSDKSRYRPPPGWMIDHHDPEKFVLRCCDCGPIAWKDDRGDAHKAARVHAIRCGNCGVNPIKQIDDGHPLVGEHLRIRYASWRSGNEMVAAGTVIGSRERPDGGHYVEIDDRESDRDRMVVVAYDEDGQPDTAKSRTEAGSAYLGDVIGASRNPLAADGGIEQ